MTETEKAALWAVILYTLRCAEHAKDHGRDPYTRAALWPDDVERQLPDMEERDPVLVGELREVIKWARRCP